MGVEENNAGKQVPDKAEENHGGQVVGVDGIEHIPKWVTILVNVPLVRGMNGFVVVVLNNGLEFFPATHVSREVSIQVAVQVWVVIREIYWIPLLAVYNRQQLIVEFIHLRVIINSNVSHLVYTTDAFRLISLNETTKVYLIKLGVTYVCTLIHKLIFVI